MILKLVLIVIILSIFLKQESIPSICYKIGKFIKTIQKLMSDLQHSFWSLYDIGELQSHLTQQHKKSNKSGKDEDCSDSKKSELNKIHKKRHKQNSDKNITHEDD
jgi:Sec-independent protein translocase protein TatA